jgi:hypothetical protein
VVAVSHPKRPAVLAVIAALIGVAASLVVAPPAHATGILTISGRVVTAAATPVGAGDVEVFYQSRIGDGAWSDEASGGVTGADGTFEIPNLELATYRLRLDYLGSGDYLDGWYHRDAQVVIAGVADATAFWDRGFSWATGDIRMLRPTAQQGRVTLPSGDPASARVTAARLDPATGEWMTAGSGTTNGSGDYTIPGLLNDYYRLSVEYLGAGYFTQSGTVVRVLPGIRNFALVPTQFGVSGRITGLTANGSVVPLEGYGVLAHDPVANATRGFAFTDADGRYTMALPTGTYLVRAWEYTPVLTGDYVATWYGGGPRKADAAPVVVGGADVAGIDISLPAGASISGTVDVAPRYAGTTTLRVNLVDQNVARSPIYNTLWVSPGEPYAFLGLPAGTYSLQVYIEENGVGTISDSWRGFDGEGDSEMIVVTRGQHATGYDIVVGAAYSALREIDDRYAELGGASGALGAPTGPPTGGGERGFRAYVGGTIFASRAHGTWVVPTGSVLNAYLAAGGPDSTFGWPTAAQDCTGGVCTQEFEGGTLPRTKPVNSAAPAVSSGSTAIGAVWTVDRGTWKGGPTPSITQAWLRCNRPITTTYASTPSGCVAISGATGVTYTSTLADAGKYLTARVTARNSLGTRTIVALTTAATQPLVKPANTVAPTVTGFSRIGLTWTLNPGSYTGTPSPTLKRAWYRCTAPVTTVATNVPAGCVAISGATGTTYTSTRLDSGKYLIAVVTATNSLGSIRAVSRSTVRIGYGDLGVRALIT